MREIEKLLFGGSAFSLIALTYVIVTAPQEHLATAGSVIGFAVSLLVLIIVVFLLVIGLYWSVLNLAERIGLFAKRYFTHDK